MERKYNLAIVGATGAVGEIMLEVLKERAFPINELHLLASEKSVGKKIEHNNSYLRVGLLDDFDFSGVDIALFSAGGETSGIHVPRAVESGCVVIDNTSFFRYQDDIPLVVPEVNPLVLANYKNRGIIANPNCSTIQMVVALKPIYDAVGISRINVCTYQAVSGAGRKAIAELATQTADLLSGKPATPRVFSKQIAFNALPEIDKFEDNGYTREEMKMVWETKKILADPSIEVNPTAVRIPVFHGHSEAIHLETNKKISALEVQALLRDAPGVIVIDDRSPGGYPTAATEANGKDQVFVGRIREDVSHPRGINLWVVSDNLRKGAATNSVQIAELLVKEHFV